MGDEPEPPMQLMGLNDDCLEALIVKGQLDTISICQLRKVCPRFRNLIEDRKPDLQTKSLKILIYLHDRIRLTVVLKNDEKFEIMYKTPEETPADIRVVSPFNRKNLKNCNFLDVFLEDLKFFVNFQKSNFENFHVAWTTEGETELYDVIYQKFKKFFENFSEEKIKAKKVTMNLNMEKEGMAILPFFDPEILEEIEILPYHDVIAKEICTDSERENDDEDDEEPHRDSDDDSSGESSTTDSEGRPYRRTPFAVKNLSRLEQWRKAKKMNMKACIRVKDVKRFQLFDESHICVTGPLEDVLELNYKFLGFPKITTIDYYPGDMRYELDEDLHIHLTEDDDIVLYYRIPDDPGRVVQMLICYRPKLATYRRIPIGDVPEGLAINE